MEPFYTGLEEGEILEAMKAGNNIEPDLKYINEAEGLMPPRLFLCTRSVSLPEGFPETNSASIGPIIGFAVKRLIGLGRDRLEEPVRQRWDYIRHIMGRSLRNSDILRVPMDNNRYGRIEKLNGPYMANTVIVAGCSGSGKNTIIDPVLKKYGNRLILPRLTTTRSPRHGETSDKYRVCVDEDTFKQKLDNGDLVMVRNRHGHWYGLDKKELEGSGSENTIPIFDTSSIESLEIIKNEFSNSKIVLVLPCPLKDIDAFSDADIKDLLRERISKRSELSPEELNKRLEEGVFFLRNCGAVKYDMLIINNSLHRLDFNKDAFEDFLVNELLVEDNDIMNVIAKEYMEEWDSYENSGVAPGAAFDQTLNLRSSIRERKTLEVFRAIYRLNPDWAACMLMSSGSGKHYSAEYILSNHYNEPYLWDAIKRGVRLLKTNAKVRCVKKTFDIKYSAEMFMHSYAWVVSKFESGFLDRLDDESMAFIIDNFYAYLRTRDADSYRTFSKSSPKRSFYGAVVERRPGIKKFLVAETIDWLVLPGNQIGQKIDAITAVNNAGSNL
jgi:guanylate kinase